MHILCIGGFRIGVKSITRRFIDSLTEQFVDLLFGNLVCLLNFCGCGIEFLYIELAFKFVIVIIIGSSCHKVFCYSSL